MARGVNNVVDIITNPTIMLDILAFAPSLLNFRRTENTQTSLHHHFYRFFSDSVVAGVCVNNNVYLLTYLLIYLHTYLLTYLLTRILLRIPGQCVGCNTASDSTRDRARYRLRWTTGCCRGWCLSAVRTRSTDKPHNEHAGHYRWLLQVTRCKSDAVSVNGWWHYE